jgi:acyl carrier protein
MLDLELDLEADLGIDTVKQAEMFAAIRAEYGIPRDDTLKLRDFPTLAHTIKFVYDRRPDLQKQLAVAPAVAAAQETLPPATATAPPLQLFLGSMEAANTIPAACRCRICVRHWSSANQPV